MGLAALRFVGSPGARSVAPGEADRPASVRPGVAESDRTGTPPPWTPPPTPAHRRRQPAIVTYGIAVASVGICLALRVLIEPYVSESSRFMIFIPALLASTWVGGAGPGVAALVLSSVTGIYFLVAPVGSFAIQAPQDLTGFAIYAVSGAIVVGLTARTRSASARIAWAQSETLDQLSRRRVAETGLHEAQEELRLLVDAVTDYALCMLDTSGRIVAWNAGAERLNGWRSEEVLGKHISVLYPQALAAEGRPERSLAEALEHGRSAEVGPRVRKDGGEFIADVVITPVRDGTGSHLGFAKITRDITELRRAQLEIEELNRSLEARVRERTHRLEEANEELDAYAHTVSHDLRAPLRAMQGFAAALVEDYGERLDDTGREYAQRIIRASRRMDQLIQDLLDYSRLAREALELRTVPLEGVVREAVGVAESQFGPGGGTIRVEGPLPAVRVHRPVLVQMLTNLLGNAVKFVRPGAGAEVTVRAREAGGIVRIEVEDRGIGIDPAHQEQIFRMFERLHGEEAYPGTGVGLAIVRRGAARMGGRAGVESTPGRGSTFWVELLAENRA